MTRLLFVLAATILALPLWGQAEFGWGLEVIPNFSNRRLIAQPNVPRDEIRALEELETARPSYSAGAFAQWRGGRAGFQTGLRFVNTGYRTVRSGIVDEDDPPLGAEQKRNDFQNLFLEIPGEILFFHELDDKNDFFFMMGFSLAYNLANYENTLFYTGESPERRRIKAEQSDFNPVHINFLSGAGWEHRFGESFALVLQPTFQFWLRSLLQQADLNRNLYAFGLKVGVKF